MHKFKAKNNKILIILSVLIGAVFALTLSYTYAYTTLTLKLGVNPNSTTTYLAKQEYSIINDTISSPVLFGEGNKLCEVAIEYGYSYDIDVRVKYSLSWSNGADTRNVILVQPNRDNFIVDNNYIFVRDAIKAGTGKLTIISAVNFADTSDERYQGATLTINIEEVKVYKASSSSSAYTSTHALVSGISSVAGTAWLKYKNPNSANAYVIMYNYNSDLAHGVSHPGVRTAYVYDGSNYKAQYGNRYYAGIGMYIVAGTSDIKITARAVGLWRTSSGDSSELVFENNISYNYAENWTYHSAFDQVFDNMYYNYIIPAGSAVYIDMIDSIEITSIGNTVDVVSIYKNYKVVSNITVNDVLFDTFTNGIASGEIPTVTNASVTNKYTQNAINIENSGKYNPYLYNYTSASQTSDIKTSVLITNNTAEKKKLSLTLRLNAIVSNGNTIKSSGNVEFTDSHYWARNEFTSTNYTASTKSFGTYIAPYSTIDLLDLYQIGAQFFNELPTISGGSYDAWVYLDVSATASTVSTSNNTSLDISASIAGSKIVVNVKNNTANKITGVSADVKLYADNSEYTAQSTQPTNWEHLYWQYYYKNTSGEYVANTSSNFSATTYYSRTIISTSLSLSGYTAYNGFALNSGTTFKSSSLTLLPGESAKVIEFSYSVSLEELNTASLTATATNASALNTIEIVNEGTANAFIVNNSAISYYVRFAGTISGTNSKIYTSNGYNYYLGIIRPGQVVALNMSAGNNLTLGTIEAGDTYSSTTLSAWGSDVVSKFDSYFSLKG